MTGDFRVVFLWAIRNEADILEQALTKMGEKDMEFYVLENWSTDKTWEILNSRKWKGCLGVERYGEKGHYDWELLLRRKEELAMEIDADWFVHQDCDEILEGPFVNKSYIEGLKLANDSGFTCVNHVWIEFRAPTDLPPGADYEQHQDMFYINGLTKCEDVQSGGEFYIWPTHSQFRAWKKSKTRVDLATSGGHHVQFPERKDCPVPFLLKHYGFRSLAQAEEKVNARFERREADRIPYLGVDRRDVLEKKSLMPNPKRFWKWDEAKFKEALPHCVNLPRLFFPVTLMKGGKKLELFKEIFDD